MINEQLFINGVEIPLSRELNPSFNRSIADIKQPEKRRSSYTKTTTVPHSKEAAKVLGFIFDINTDTNIFDATKKADIVYIVAGASIYGYAQLKNIVIVNKYDIEYQIVIFGNFANLFKEIEGSLLEDITGLAKYDHILNQEIQNLSTGNNGEPYQIIESGGLVAAALGKGYIYALVDYGFSNDGTTFHVTDIGASIFVQEYWDAIFSDAGFTYDFLDSAFADHFKHLIIPSSPENFLLDADEIDLRQFEANTTILTSTGTSISNNLTKGSFTALDPIIFTNEVSDPGTVYDNATGVYTAPGLGNYDIASIIDVEANFKPVDTVTSLRSVGFVIFQVALEYFDISAGTTTLLDAVEIRMKHDGFSIGNRSTDSSPIYPNEDYFTVAIFSGTEVPRENNPPNRILVSTSNLLMNTGDTVKVVWSANYDKDLTNYFIDGVGAFSDGNSEIAVVVGSYYNRVSNLSMLEGELFQVSKAIPKNVKQTDFLMNYIKEYNLYIDLDPDNEKNLLIAPRDSFYTNNVVDLRGKISTDKGVQYAPMGALDARTYIFKHKDDGDYLNAKYLTDWRETYGQREIISTNEFSEKINTNQVSASPTTLADMGTSNNRVISTIIQVDELGARVSTKHNWRTLYYGGLKDNYENWTHDSDVFPPISQTQYPYAGHFDDPFNPTLDINFGLVKELYYLDLIEPISPTDNNLYNKYHSKMIREITDKDSKIALYNFTTT